MPRRIASLMPSVGPLIIWTRTHGDEFACARADFDDPRLRVRCGSFVGVGSGCQRSRPMVESTWLGIAPKPAPGGGGFQKRNLYLAPSFLPGTLTGPAVDHTNIDDPQLRQAIAGVHESLVSREDSLDIEARLELIAERIAAHLGTDPPTRAARERRLALALRALLDEHTTDSLTLADAAARLERSPAHLLRTFTLEFGISPHAYVIGRRVEAARRKLLEGVSVAEVAVAVGFYDQAHLTRHFKRHTSVTPARFASSHVLAPTRSAGGDSRERDAVGPRFRSVSH
jgi:AraC-like DNA-binding protein